MQWKEIEEFFQGKDVITVADEEYSDYADYMKNREKRADAILAKPFRMKVPRSQKNSAYDGMVHDCYLQEVVRVQKSDLYIIKYQFQNGSEKVANKTLIRKEKNGVAQRLGLRNAEGLNDLFLLCKNEVQTMDVQKEFSKLDTVEQGEAYDDINAVLSAFHIEPFVEKRIQIKRKLREGSKYADGKVHECIVYSIIQYADTNKFIVDYMDCTLQLRMWSVFFKDAKGQVYFVDLMDMTGIGAMFAYILEEACGKTHGGGRFF